MFCILALLVCKLKKLALETVFDGWIYQAVGVVLPVAICSFL